MKRPTVRESWQSFAAAVMPGDAPPVQRQEMKRAFYAGAWAMLCTAEQLGDPAVSEEDGVKVLEALKQECRAFQQDVAVGRA